jgi:hypothetical protein
VLSLSLLQPYRPHRLASQNLLGLEAHGFVGFEIIGRRLLESDILKSGSIAVVDNVLGIKVMQQLLKFVDVLQVGCVELYLLFVAEIACTHLKNAGTVAQLRLFFPHTHYFRYCLVILPRFRAP